MSAPVIDVILSPFPYVPKRGIDFEDDFVTFFEAFMDFLKNVMEPEINAILEKLQDSIDWINTTATQVNQDATQVANDKSEVTALKASIETLGGVQGLYPDTATGIANTVDSELFAVYIAGEDFYSVYANESNVAVFKYSNYTKEYINRVSQKTPLIDLKNIKTYTDSNGNRLMDSGGLGNKLTMYTGQMLSFNTGGSGQSILLNNPYTPTGSTNWSVFLSIKTTDNQGDLIYESGAKNIRIVSGEISYVGVNSITSVNDGNYHRIVITFSGDQMKIYIDGVLDNTNTITATNAINPFSIGGATYVGDMGNITIIDGVAATDNDILLDFMVAEDILGVVKGTVQTKFTFDNADILACFPLQEGIKIGGFVKDIKNNVSYAIINYLSTMWSGASSLTCGLQNALLPKDDIDNSVEDIGTSSPFPILELGNSGTITTSESAFEFGIENEKTMNLFFNAPSYTTRGSTVEPIPSFDCAPLGIKHTANSDSILVAKQTYTINYTANTWYMLTISFKAQANGDYIAKIYLNAVLQATKIIADTSTRNFYLGSTSFNSSAIKMAGIELHNREFNQSEVNNLYNYAKTNDPTMALP